MGMIVDSANSLVNGFLLAFLMTIMALKYTHSNSKKSHYRNKILKMIVWTYSASLLGQMIWMLVSGRDGYGYYLSNWAVGYFIVLMPVLFSGQCSLYVDSVIFSEKNKMKRLNKYFQIIFIVMAILLLLSLPFGTFFYIDAHNFYQHGPFLLLYFFIPLLYQVYTWVQMAKYHKKLIENSSNYRALILMSVAVSLGFVTQVFILTNGIVFFHGIAMCIMFLKASNYEKLEQEKLYKNIFNRMNVALAIYNAEGCYEYVNPFYVKMLTRYKDDDIIHAGEVEFKEFIDEKIIGKTRRAILEDGRYQAVQKFYEKYHGEDFQGLVEGDQDINFVTILNIEVMEEIHKVAICTDMTNYIQIQDQLKENIYRTNLYETAFKNADYGISIFSSGEKINYINEYYANLIYQKTPHELIGKNIFYSVCKTPEKVAIWRKRFQEAVKKRSGEVQIPVWGKIHDFTYNVVSVHDHINNEENYICILRDITENKKMEHKITEQLKSLKSLSSAKDDFIANVSHEIRTPINAILGMIYRLKSTELSCKQVDYVHKIDNAANILLALINDVLDFSKFNASKIELSRVNFNLHHVMEAVKVMFETKCKEKGIEFRTNYHFARTLTVCGDQVRFSQVLLNFVSNAVKFTDRGSVLVEMRILEENTQQVQLKVSVIDTGIGISEGNLSRIWKSFEQVDSSTTKNYQGTGLGLAISKQIIDCMQGEIWGESFLNEGSSFHFIVTFDKAVQEVLQEKVKAETTEVQFKGKKILVVEDNEINAEIVGYLIEELGLSYEVAYDGQEAVEYCRDKGPAYYGLILMDIHMPRMNGYDASIKVRELGINAPIIALSAALEDVEMRNKMVGIIDDYLTKPIQPIELKKYLLRQLT